MALKKESCYPITLPDTQYHNFVVKVGVIQDSGFIPGHWDEVIPSKHRTIASSTWPIVNDWEFQNLGAQLYLSFQYKDTLSSQSWIPFVSLKVAS